jgi:hypothetical protein
VISEANRVLRPDERGQILLPPGMHDLRVSNRTLGYEATWNVEIKPGATTNLRVTPEPSKLTVTSPESAKSGSTGKGRGHSIERRRRSRSAPTTSSSDGRAAPSDAIRLQSASSRSR